MLSPSQIAQAFPREAKLHFTQEIAYLRTQIAWEEEYKRKSAIQMTDWHVRWFLELVVIEGANERIAKYQARIKRLTFALRPRKVAAGITDDTIAQARAVPIESLYEGQLRRVWSRLVGRCPFHEEESASFTIYVDQNSWWCFGCSIGGSVIDYVMQLRKCEFVEAVKFLTAPQ